MTPFPNSCDGYICVPHIFLHKEPLHRSEKISQLWFSEPIRIHKTMPSWVYIETLWDHYSGWCLKSAVYTSASLICNGLLGWLSVPHLTSPLQNNLLVPFTFHFLFGTPFFQYNHATEGTYPTRWGILKIPPHCLTPPLTTFEPLLSNHLQTFLGIPYTWGGKCLSGADCSGLTQWLYTLLNKRIPRDSNIQAQVGKEVTIEALKPGDLLFFSDQKTQNINHVGLYIGNSSLLHLSEKHGISTIDHIDSTGQLKNLPSYTFVKACRYM